MSFFKKIFYSFSLVEKIIFFTALIGFFTTFSFWIYQNYFKNIKYIPATGGIYIEGLIGPIEKINPLFINSDAERDIVFLIFSKLIDLTEKWSKSNDNKVFTIFLYPDIKWHDGEKLTANDVLFTINLIKQIDKDSVFKDVEVKKINSQKITFTLPFGDKNFLKNFDIYILPKHILENKSVKDLETDTFNLNPIGSGPYRMERIERDETGKIISVNLGLNKNYYQTKPLIEKIIFKVYLNNEEILNAYKDNLINGISRIFPENYKEAKQIKNLSIYSQLMPFYTGIFFNCEDSFLKNKNIRQALSYGLNKNEILEKAVYNRGQKTGQIVLPEKVALSIQNSFNLRKAQVLSKSIENKKKLKITFLDNQRLEKIFEIIKKQWEDLGFSVEADKLSMVQLQKVLKEGNYQILLSSQYLDDEQIQIMWHSSQIKYLGVNLSRYKNAKIDDLIEKAFEEKNTDKKNDLFKKSFGLVSKDFPALFIYQPYYDYGVNEAIKNINLTKIINSSDRFLTIADWYIKMKRSKNK